MNLNSEIREALAAAVATDKANARLGNGDKCPWTAEQWRDYASSLMAEAGMEGCCPVCRNVVHSNSSARIMRHRDNVGADCAASGLWFHVAVEVVA